MKKPPHRNRRLWLLSLLLPGAIIWLLYAGATAENSAASASERTSDPVASAQSEAIPSPVGRTASAQPEETDPMVVEEAAQPPQPPPAAQPSPSPPPEEAAPIPAIREYVVQPGDTLEAIARQFGLQPSSLLWSNEIADEDLLQVGQRLLIPPVDGIIHTVREGDTFWDIALMHDVDVDAVIEANPALSPDTLQPGDHLIVPGGKPARSQPAVSRSAVEREATASGGERLLWPASGEITSAFGWRTHPVYGTPNFHEGVDIGLPEGTPIRAAGSGTVVYAGWYGGWGLTVKVDHGGGLITRYSHNSELLVSPGQWVEAGQVIARSGNTGVSTGPHLDFGVYLWGKPVEPLPYLTR